LPLLQIIKIIPKQIHIHCTTKRKKNNIAEILLKVALNTINQINNRCRISSCSEGGKTRIAIENYNIRLLLLGANKYRILKQYFKNRFLVYFDSFHFLHIWLQW
jgi:stage III sporulation protein SpoIIIAA